MIFCYGHQSRRREAMCPTCYPHPLSAMWDLNLSVSLFSNFTSYHSPWPQTQHHASNTELLSALRERFTARWSAASPCTLLSSNAFLCLPDRPAYLWMFCSGTITSGRFLSLQGNFSYSEPQISLLEQNFSKYHWWRTSIYFLIQSIMD